MRSRITTRRLPDDREVCDAYFADRATLKDCIKAIEESDRGDKRRREIEDEFNRLSRHFRTTAY